MKWLSWCWLMLSKWSTWWIFDSALIDLIDLMLWLLNFCFYESKCGLIIYLLPVPVPYITLDHLLCSCSRYLLLIFYVCYAHSQHASYRLYLSERATILNFARQEISNEITASFYNNVKGKLTGVNLLNNLKLGWSKSTRWYRIVYWMTHVDTYRVHVEAAEPIIYEASTVQ